MGHYFASVFCHQTRHLVLFLGEFRFGRVDCGDSAKKIDCELNGLKCRLVAILLKAVAPEEMDWIGVKM